MEGVGNMGTDYVLWLFLLVGWLLLCGGVAWYRLFGCGNHWFVEVDAREDGDFIVKQYGCTKCHVVIEKRWPKDGV